MFCGPSQYIIKICLKDHKISVHTYKETLITGDFFENGEGSSIKGRFSGNKSVEYFQRLFY